MKLRGDSALVLFSGGQDSTTCLAWALDCYAMVETIGFNYGQRHAVELECRSRVLEQLRRDFSLWSPKLGSDHMLSLNSLGNLSETALTRDVQIAFDEFGLPTTFVPGRNLLFFMYAAIVAYRRGIRTLVGGMCETDFSGYPDCRDDSLKALQVALNLGLSSRFIIEAPLMWLDKARTWRLAASLGGEQLIDLIIRETHTCYMGSREVEHGWGFGCGDCPACDLRRSGFKAFKASQCDHS